MLYYKWIPFVRRYLEDLSLPNFTLFVMVAGQYVADRLYVTRMHVFLAVGERRSRSRSGKFVESIIIPDVVIRAFYAEVEGYAR